MMNRDYTTLKNWMSEQNVGVRRLASLSGISAALISRILSGTVNPTVATANKILKATGLKYEDVFMGDDLKDA